MFPMIIFISVLFSLWNVINKTRRHGHLDAKICTTLSGIFGGWSVEFEKLVYSVKGKTHPIAEPTCKFHNRREIVQIVRLQGQLSFSSETLSSADPFCFPSLETAVGWAFKHKVYYRSFGYLIGVIFYRI